MWTHVFGLFGEFLNFLGAVVLACDVFMRQKEHILKEDLDRLASLEKSNNLNSTTYKGFFLSSDDFSQKVLHRRSALTAYCGIALLAFGFLLLVAYHGILMWYANQK